MIKPTIIAHRGNILDINLRIENDINLIEKEVFTRGFDVEVDLNKDRDGLYLSHDTRDYTCENDFQSEKIVKDFLITYQTKLWIHCKDRSSLQWCIDTPGIYRYFYHEGKEGFVTTSVGKIWDYSYWKTNVFNYKSLEKSDINFGIVVLPEEKMLFHPSLMKCTGICTDYPLTYQYLININNDEKN